MRPDIVNLRQFYTSRLGRKVKARLRRLARQHWAGQSGGITVAMGYATPMEDPHGREAERATPFLALMPWEQGGLYWPVHGENCTVIGDVLRPPLAPNSVARVTMMHVLEHSPQPEEMLRITWQMLAPGGRLLLVVPNRRGLWARLGQTPFAMGTPYRLNDIKALLNRADFTLRDISSALYAPPSLHPFWLRGWGFYEWLGSVLLPRSGGIFMIEAEKQIYATIGERARKPVTQQAWNGGSAVPSYRQAP